VRNVLAQLVKFGGVGLAATAVHAVIYAGLGKIIAPAWANLYAFSVAFIVSYLGHRYVSFAQAAPVRGSLLRFVVVALVGLLLNAGFVQAVTLAQLDYRWALLPMLFFVPGVTFLLSKYWAFRHG